MEFGVYDSATNQLIELAADAISAYVCPPAFLSAASLLGIPFESAGSSNGALARFFKYSDHPPFDTRLLLMKNVLHLTDGLNQNQLFAEHANRVVTFIGRKNLVGLTPISFEFLEDYEDLCKDFCWDVIRSLPALGIKKFERSDWASVRDAIIKQDYTPLSPVQLLMVGWLKRLTTVRNPNSSNLQKYLALRLHEEKAFETIVHLMHKYYETQLIAKMESDWNDIRNSHD